MVVTPNYIRAILWAQLRTMRNSVGRRSGIVITAIIGVFWYGMWTLFSIGAARFMSDADNFTLAKTILPGALLLIFLYWQVVPLLLAATGASLDLRKLQVYPVPVGHLFLIEALLRVTAGIEPVIVIAGTSIGMLFNPRFAWWAPLAFVPFIAMNLFLSAGLRDVLVRLLARKRIREIAALLLVLIAALPQLLLSRVDSRMDARFRWIFSHDPLVAAPWTVIANLATNQEVLFSLSLAVAWTVGALIFGRWQFQRTLSFDMEAARAGDSRAGTGRGIMERFFRLPSLLFPDPLGALIEKELRFLVRSPRFRLVFIMGFTFGLVVMLPVTMGRRGGGPTSFLGTNYLTVVSMYALLLLSDVCFWNAFGFDRSAAQFYFLAPIKFTRVLIGKNLSAMFFVTLEVAMVTTVCAVFGLKVDVLKLVEAYTIAVVISLFLMTAGNMLSVQNARGVNPANAMRRGTVGQVQAYLLLIYPLAFTPAGLAYLARWLTGSEWALFGVLAIFAVIGTVVYRMMLESVAEKAEQVKEQMLTALAAGDGPIT